MDSASKSASAFGAALKSMAANMAISLAVSLAIQLAYKALDNYIHRLEYATEAMADANDKFESSSQEVESLSQELDTCEVRLRELQKLSDNGTISIIEQEELDRLKEENIELETNLKLKEEERKLNAINAAEAATKSLETEVVSNYKESVLAQTPRPSESRKPFANVNPEEELSLAIQAYSNAEKDLKDLQLQFNSEQNTMSTELYKEEKARIDGLILSARERALEMGKIVTEASQAYENKEALGEELTETEKAHYEAVKKSQEQYSGFIDDINKNTDAVKENTNAKQENAQTDFGGINLESLNNQIDSIQSAYKSLTTATEEYNQHGYITADTLQSLLNLDSQYLSCLINENGQLQINAETYQKLVQAKLADAEAAAVEQAVTELNAISANNEAKNNAASTQVLYQKTLAVAALSNSYGAVAQSAAAAAQAEALVTAMQKASTIDPAETDRVMSNLNAKLALIQNTATKTSGSFGALKNHLNGFDKASSGVDKLTKSLEKQKEVAEETKNKMDKLHEAISWFWSKKKDGIQDQINALEKLNDSLESQIDNMDGAVDAINNAIDIRIEALEKEKDALKENTDEAEKQLELAKARLDLETAKRNRVQLYESGKGFVYQDDPRATKEAELNLADLEEEMRVDATTKKIDEEIERLEKLQDAWSGVANAFNDALNEDFAKNIWGDNWKDVALNPTDDQFNDFKNQYSGIQGQISNNNNRISGLELELEKLEELAELWGDAVNARRDYLYTQELESFFGSDYEHELLTNSITWRNKFASEYSSICEEIESIETRIKEANEATTESVTSGANTGVNSLKGLGGKVDELQYKLQNGQNIGTYLWGQADDAALNQAVIRLYEVNKSIDNGDQGLEVFKSTLEEFISSYRGLKESGQVTDELSEKISNLSQAFANTDFESVTDGVSNRLGDISNYTQIITDDVGKVNETLENIDIAKNTVEQDVNEQVVDTTATIDSLNEKVSALEEGLSNLHIVKQDIENTVSEEEAQTGTLVADTLTKVEEIKGIVDTLSESMVLLQTSMENLTGLMSTLDSVTFSKVINSIGFGADIGSESLLGALNNVVSMINGEQGVIAKLQSLNNENLDTIIAEFNGDSDSLRSSIFDVCNAIYLEDDETCLVNVINSLTTTIESIDTVTDAFLRLTNQADAGLQKLIGIEEKLAALDGKESHSYHYIHTIEVNGEATGTAWTGKGFSTGTATTSGKAYNSGNWGLQQDQPKSLIAELQPEILLRNGQYKVFYSPSLVDLKRGDIIFNGDQTRAILTSGRKSHIEGLAKQGAIASQRLLSRGGLYGNAFANGTLPIDNEMLGRLRSTAVNYNVKLDSLHAEKSLSTTTGERNTVLQFNGDLSFPNIHSSDDAEKLIRELLRLSNKASQRANKR